MALRYLLLDIPESITLTVEFLYAGYHSVDERRMCCYEKLISPVALFK